MNKHIQRTALTLVVLSALGSAAMAQSYYENDQQHYYQNQRVIKSTASHRAPGTYATYTNKVVDKTQLGVGADILKRLGDIATSGRYQDVMGRQQAMQTMLDKEKPGKFTVAVYNKNHGAKHVDIYMVFDSNRLDAQMRQAERDRLREHNKNYRLRHQEQRTEPKEWKRFADRVNTILEQIGVPWNIDKLIDHKQSRQDREIYPREVYHVKEYRVVDLTDSLSKEDKQLLQDFAAPYTGERILGKNVLHLEDENQDYLDRAYGKHAYQVIVRKSAENKNELEIYVDYATNHPETNSVVRLGIVGDIYSLPRTDLYRIDDLLADYQSRSGKPKDLAKQAENAVSQYLNDQYGKNTYKVKLVYRYGNFYQIRVKH